VARDHVDVPPYVGNPYTYHNVGYYPGDDMYSGPGAGPGGGSGVGGGYDPMAFHGGPGGPSPASHGMSQASLGLPYPPWMDPRLGSVPPYVPVGAGAASAGLGDPSAAPGAPVGAPPPSHVDVPWDGLRYSDRRQFVQSLGALW
jgi:hypothetical protein